MYFRNEKEFKRAVTIIELIFIALFTIGSSGCFLAIFKICTLMPIWAAILDAVLFGVSGIAFAGIAIFLLIFQKEFEAGLKAESIILNSEDSEEA